MAESKEGRFILLNNETEIKYLFKLSGNQKILISGFNKSGNGKFRPNCVRGYCFRSLLLRPGRKTVEVLLTQRQSACFAFNWGIGFRKLS